MKFHCLLLFLLLINLNFKKNKKKKPKEKLLIALFDLILVPLPSSKILKFLISSLYCSLSSPSFLYSLSNLRKNFCA